MNVKFTLRHYIGDVLVCAVLVISLMVICAIFFDGDSENKKVRVLQDGKEIAVYYLSDSSSLYVDGVHIKVCDGRAFIAESDCADKICMGMPGVDKSGGGSVCIPNRIVIEPIEDNNSTDAVAG